MIDLNNNPSVVNHPLVIIPTYNEYNTVTIITEGVFAHLPQAHILFVDDRSPDGTAERITELINTYEGRVFLLSRMRKEGIGRAYVAGFEWGLARGYPYIFEMDADFSHHPRYLPAMLAACTTDVDFVVGSRYVKGGCIANWDTKRVLLSKMASVYTRLITGMPILDPTAGFVGYRACVLEKINLSALRFKGYAFQIEMKHAAWQYGFRFLELPIDFVDRKVGQSKMNFGIVGEAIKGVIQLKWDAWRGRYKR